MYKKKWKFLWISLVLFSLLLGCGNPQSSMEKSSQKAAPATEDSSANHLQSEATPSAPAGYSEKGAQAVKNGQSQRKIIKQADIMQKVTELDPAMKKVQQLVDHSGGFIQSSSIQQLTDTQRQADYVIRIPQENYLSVVDQFMQVGKNEMITQKGEDVTQTYYDNEARIKNLRSQEEAVRKLLDQAQKMEDILKIQQELFRIRGEIEQLQGQNRYLDNMSSLSTIHLTIQEAKPIELAKDSPWAQATQGFLASLEEVGDFFVQLFVFLISYLPVILFIYIPLGLFIWWIYRRRKAGSGWPRAKKSKNDHDQP